MKIFITFFFVVLLVFYYFYAHDSYTTNATRSHTSGVVAEREVTAENILKSENHSEAVPGIKKPEESNVNYGIHDIYEWQGWLAARGYSSKENLDNYAAYGDKELFELAKQGDIDALDTMASKLIDAGEIQKAMPLYLEAAIRGSTPALLQIATIFGPMPVEGETAEMRKEIRRKTAIEGLAIMKTAEMRGDASIAKAGTFSATLHYEYTYGPLNLTEQEKQYIDTRGEEFYGLLQAERNKLGLGDFDNKVPRFVKALDALDKR